VAEERQAQPTRTTSCGRPVAEASGVSAQTVYDSIGSKQEAAATLAALSDFRLALIMRDSYGWPLDRIEPGWSQRPGRCC